MRWTFLNNYLYKILILAQMLCHFCTFGAMSYIALLISLVSAIIKKRLSDVILFSQFTKKLFLIFRILSSIDAI